MSKFALNDLLQFTKNRKSAGTYEKCLQCVCVCAVKQMNECWQSNTLYAGNFLNCNFCCWLQWSLSILLKIEMALPLNEFLKIRFLHRTKKFEFKIIYDSVISFLNFMPLFENILCCPAALSDACLFPAALYFIHLRQFHRFVHLLTFVNKTLCIDHHRNRLARKRWPRTNQNATITPKQRQLYACVCYILRFYLLISTGMHFINTHTLSALYNL